jgi:hypothetical protein
VLVRQNALALVPCRYSGIVPLHLAQLQSGSVITMNVLVV